MAKSRKQKTSKVPIAELIKTPEPIGKCWRIFFREQRSPLVRSQLISALMSGHQLETERLPNGALLDVVVLSMATRNYLEAEVIDDYTALLTRTERVWKDPLWTRRMFDQTHMNAASFILMGKAEFTSAEDLYVPELVEWILDQEPPVYFTEELSA